MKKVYQSRIEKKHGTCMQATIASLFELFIEDVPNFIEMEDSWFIVMSNFYKERGYELCCFNPQGKIELTKQVLEVDKGIGGYWAASVVSVNLGPEITHSVVIDKNMNVVHDPNPNNYGHVYCPEDILAIDVCSDNWYIDVNGSLILQKT